jgi:polysaccharide export outer membrane protein
MCILSVAGCGLPRSGPSRGELVAARSASASGAAVVAVDDRVVRAAAPTAEPGFPAAFLAAGAVTADVIAAGDVLGLRIWENVESGLLSGGGAGQTSLDEVQVDDDGFIFVPYAGRIAAAGSTPEALRLAIADRLAAQTPDPQVAVVRMPGDGATISVLGSVGGQGVYPVERPTRRITGLLARAGGVAIDPEVARVTLRRGAASGSVRLSEIYADPRLDVALRAGDVVLVEEDSRSFVALGATGGQRRVTFDSPTLSALDALAQVGGLSSQLADPRGIFILREEPDAVAREVTGRDDLTGPQRVIYTIDLTAPDGLFLARAFTIRDGDTVYVTEAPYVRWQKSLQVLTGSVGTANALSGLAGD